MLSAPFFPSPFQFQLLNWRIACTLCNAILHSTLCYSVSCAIVVICVRCYLYMNRRLSFCTRLLNCCLFGVLWCFPCYFLRSFLRCCCCFSIFIICTVKLRGALMFCWMNDQTSRQTNEAANWWNQIKIKTIHVDTLAHSWHVIGRYVNFTHTHTQKKRGKPINTLQNP